KKHGKLKPNGKSQTNGVSKTPSRKSPKRSVKPPQANGNSHKSSGRPPTTRATSHPSNGTSTRKTPPQKQAPQSSTAPPVLSTPPLVAETNPLIVYDYFPAWGVDLPFNDHLNNIFFKPNPDNLDYPIHGPNVI